MQKPKTAHCESCPAREADGRCRGEGQGLRQDVAFVLGPPKAAVKYHEYKSFTDSIGQLFMEVLHTVQKERPELAAIKCFFTHATECILDEDDAETVKHCRTHVHQNIIQSGARVIVPLGASAMKSFGINTSVDAVRGKSQFIKLGGEEVLCVPTYNPGILFRKESSGLLMTFKADVKKALMVALHGNTTPAIDELTKDYRVCKTVAEGIKLCEDILALRTPGTDTLPLLSVDTETTGLKTWEPGFRILAISFAWGRNRSGAILLNHREMKEDWKLLVPYIKRVLEGDNPKVFHNYQYDFKVLCLALGWKVNRVIWDSMHAEYLLDENKAGLYGLKEIVKTRVPEFTDYEKSIKQFIKRGPSAESLSEVESWKSKLAEYKDDLKACLEEKKKISCLAELSKAAAATQKKFWTERAFAIKGLITIGKIGLKDAKIRLKDSAKLEMNFENIPVDDLLLYAAIDTDCTRQITVQQRTEIMADDKDLIHAMQTVMIPAAETLGRMEHEGIKVDMPYLDKLEIEFQEIMDKTSMEIKAEVGRDFNINANKEIIKILVMQLGINLTKQTKKKTAMAVDSDVLEGLEGQYPLVGKILRYRQAHKAKNTFIKGIKKNATGDGRVHANFNLTTTATGRTSSSGPNMQNISAKGILGKNIKKIFVPDSDDEVFVNMDYSGAEVRVLCAYAHDQGLIDTLNQGLGIHSFVASEVFKVIRVKRERKLDDGSVEIYYTEFSPTYEDYEFRKKKYSESDKELYLALDQKRQAAKAMVFLTIYGGGPQKLQENLVKEDESITLMDCEGYINTFLNRFPVIRQYMDRIKKEINQRASTKTRFGRKRRFPLSKIDFSFRNAAYREAINFPIQATSSDLVLCQLTEMMENAHEIGMKARVTVHDSIGFSMPKANVEKVRAFLDKYAEERVREKFAWMPVPFIYEADYGDSYGECNIEIK